MSVPLVKKKTGAPTGQLKVSIGSASYTWANDASQVDIPTPIYYEYTQHPYLDAVSGSGTYFPPPVLEQVQLVDGVLSKWNGSAYEAVAVGGGGPSLPYAVATAGNAGSIQTALNAAKHVVVPAGTYTVTTTLNGAFSGQTLECSPGVTFVAGSSSAIIDTTDKDDWTFKGADCVFDLNQTANIGIRIRGNTTTIKNPKMERFTVKNRDLPPAFTAAAIISKADRGMSYKARIENYGTAMTGGANVAYGMYLEECTRGRVYDTEVENARVGVEFWNCFDCKAQNGYMKTLSDNGVYCTGTTGARNTFARMTIDGCEEGIAVNNDDTTIDECTLMNNTNTGITMRGKARTKVLNSRFENNPRHIGDDNGLANSTANSSFLISGNHFGDVSLGTNEQIQLRWFKRGRIVNNFFRRTSGTAVMILVSGTATDNAGDHVTIEGNEFDDVNRTGTTACIRVSIGSGLCNYTKIERNRFLNAVTAINLFNAAGTPGIGTQINDNFYGPLVTNTVTSSAAAIKYTNTPTQTRPDSIAGIAAWYAAEQVVDLADAAAVPQWSDLSGNNRHLLQATGAAQPTWRQVGTAGFPAVRFDGTDDVMQVATFSLAQPFEMFVVTKQTATGNRTIIDGLTLDSGSIKRGGTTVMNISAGTNSANVAGSPQSKLRLFHASFAAGVNSFLRIDNGAAVLNDVGAGNPGGLTVGASGALASFYPGDISEIIVFNRQLSAGEREQLRAALAVKYRDRWI